MIYFAYGSNIEYGQMKHRCPDSHIIGVATLHGYQLAFRGPLDIEENRRAQTPGILYHISEDDLDNLDAREGYPTCYTRKMIHVSFKGGIVEAMTYYMTDERKKSARLIPSKVYVDTVHEGYLQQNLSAAPLLLAFDTARNLSIF